MQYKSMTKIVCTIGPASSTHEILCDMINAGMDVARLNFSHGDFTSHRESIGQIRRAIAEVGRPVALMADLPGPKMRIGAISSGNIRLHHDHKFTLTIKEMDGDENIVSVSFKDLPNVVRPGDKLFLNDGYVQLEVEEISADKTDVVCKVLVGGDLSSRKGLNLPGIKLGISAFTEHDFNILRFALELGVEAVSQSFVETADDIIKVRNAAAELGYNPFIIAKIERIEAYQNLEEILQVSDGIMIARGDLGVELPIEKMAVIQKEIMRAANNAGKPVITATQMLESMIFNSRPTRAEATDVANAILDGTDAVMLSGESAVGSYPVAAVAMLSQIAVNTESYYIAQQHEEKSCDIAFDGANFSNLMASAVQTALHFIRPAAIIVPTFSGHTARRVSGLRLAEWVTAITNSHKTAHDLVFSYGIDPIHLPELPDDWPAFSRQWVKDHNLPGNWVILTEGPSEKNPKASHKMEIIDLSKVPVN